MPDIVPKSERGLTDMHITSLQSFSTDQPNTDQQIDPCHLDCPPATLTLSSPKGLVAHQRDIVHQIDLKDLDMTNYVTALQPGFDPMSNTAKSRIGLLWGEQFTPLNVEHLKTTKTGARALNIAVLGSGVAGSMIMAAAAGKGHNVTVFERRSHAPIRENLVTVNATSRRIIEETRAKTDVTSMFQTDGQLGFSERLPIKDIESHLQHLAMSASPQNCRLVKGADVIAINADSLEPQASYIDFKLDGELVRLNNIDLVVIATGARSTNPFCDQKSLVKEMFPVTPISHKSALIFAKIRESGQHPHKEYDAGTKLTEGKHGQSQARFINAYTGYSPLNIQQQGEPALTETSLLFDAPLCAADSNDATHAAVKEILPSLEYVKDEPIESLIKTLAAEHKSEPVIIQKGAAKVFHWIVDKAYAQDKNTGKAIPVVIVGDAACPPNPWTGSGANIGIQSVEPVMDLLEGLSAASTRSDREMALELFHQSSHPLRMQSLLRGTFASQVFERNHPN